MASNADSTFFTTYFASSVLFSKWNIKLILPDMVLLMLCYTSHFRGPVGQFVPCQFQTCGCCHGHMDKTNGISCAVCYSRTGRVRKSLHSLGNLEVDFDIPMAEEGSCLQRSQTFFFIFCDYVEYITAALWLVFTRDGVTAMSHQCQTNVCVVH